MFGYTMLLEFLKSIYSRVIFSVRCRWITEQYNNALDLYSAHERGRIEHKDALLEMLSGRNQLLPLMKRLEAMGLSEIYEIESGIE